MVESLGVTVTGHVPPEKTITMYAREVPWDQVLEHALRSHGMTYRRTESGAHVVPVTSTP